MTWILMVIPHEGFKLYLEKGQQFEINWENSSRRLFLGDLALLAGKGIWGVFVWKEREVFVPKVLIVTGLCSVASVKKAKILTFLLKHPWGTLSVFHPRGRWSRPRVHWGLRDHPFPVLQARHTTYPGVKGTVLHLISAFFQDRNSS